MTSDKKGVILLQTLVMVVILAMIGIMTLKWVLGRHIVTTKVSKSVNCRALADACLAQKIALWGGTDPLNGIYHCTIEAVDDVEVTVSGPAGSKTLAFKVKYDVCTY